MIETLNCPCGQSILVRRDRLAQGVVCPHCGRRFLPGRVLPSQPKPESVDSERRPVVRPTGRVRGASKPARAPKRTTARPTHTRVPRRRDPARSQRTSRAGLPRSWTGIAGGALVLVAVLILILSRSRDDESEVPPRQDGAAQATASTTAPASTADIVAAALPAIAVVSDGTSTATGFLISAGFLVTNAHVTASMFPDGMQVRFPASGGKQVRVYGVIYEDASRDLCLIRVASSTQPLQFASGGPPRPGEDVLIIGNPALGGFSDRITIENAVTRGTLGSTVRLDGQTWIQISASVNPGNSGGPVLNRKGEVVAVATLKAAEQEGIAFGIPASALKNALSALANGSNQERAGTRHSLRAAFQRLRAAGFLCFSTMELYRTAFVTAIAANVPPGGLLTKLKPKVDAMLKEARSHFQDDLTRNMNRIQKFPDLFERTGLSGLGGDIEEFYGVILRAEIHLNVVRLNPTWKALDMRDYMKHAISMVEEFQRLDGRIARDLHMKPLPPLRDD